ncbi:MAG: KOW domain-containing RNA-binding protein [Clostridia bacterium]|nr:KOW domain-containing RNA-binding protein [Clostridia bacterium]
MDDIIISSIVRSLNGRDEGRLFVVIGFPKENHVSIANGRQRKIESPKIKKLKHIELVTQSSTRTAQKLRTGDKVTNAELRREIAGVENCSDEASDSMTGGI